MPRTSIASIDNYDPAENRPITVRINNSHGTASEWIDRTLDFGGRVDRPAMAAWGSGGVLVTFTDANTGDIMLLTCGDLTGEEQPPPDRSARRPGWPTTKPMATRACPWSPRSGRASRRVAESEIPASRRRTRPADTWAPS